jgi:hypothetical protein
MVEGTVAVCVGGILYPEETVNAARRVDRA